MKCLNTTKLISLQNNLLHNSESQEINDHIQSCNECKKKLENYNKYRELFKHKLHFKSPSKNTQCFDEFELVTYLEDGLNRKLRSKYYLHLSQCQSCLDNLISLENLLHELKTEGLLTSRKGIKEKAIQFINIITNTTKEKLKSLVDMFTKPKPAYRWIGTVAIFILAVLIFVPHENINLNTFITRENQQDFFENGIHLISPANEFSMDKDNPEFRWIKMADVSRYTILLLDANGDIVWEKQTSENRLKLPHDIRLLPSMTYYWQVEAVFEDGSSIVSEMSSFIITQ